VKASYSTNTGNSLRYRTASSKTLDSNMLWKFYQIGKEDVTVTPAHLLVLPTDNAKILNHLNFSEIGANTLKESQAFRKIRQSSKTFTSNLVLSPATLTSKYNTLADLYLRDTVFTDSLSYGNVRQHNLTANMVSVNNQKVTLDTSSSVKLIKQNFGFTNFDSSRNLNSVANVSGYEGNYANTQAEVSVSSVSNPTSNSSVIESSTLNTNHMLSVNSHTEKENLNHPLLKLSNEKVLKANGSLSNDQVSSYVSQTSEPNSIKPVVATKSLTTASSLESYTPADQSVRSVKKLTASKPKLNFSLQLNPYNGLLSNSNSNLLNSTLSGRDGFDFDASTSSRILSNRLSMDFTSAPTLSNNPLYNDFHFDSKHSLSVDTSFKGRTVTTK